MAGSVTYYEGNYLAQTAVGTTGQVLTSNGASAPSWGSGSSVVKFSAYLATPVTAVTGNNTNYTILFDTVIVDTASGYDPSTGIYTFPNTGVYFISYNVWFTGISIGQTRMLGFLNTGSLGVAGPGAFDLNPFAVADDAGEVGIGSTAMYSVTAGETISVLVDVYGGAKTVGIGENQWTNFNIFQLA